MKIPEKTFQPRGASVFGGIGALWHGVSTCIPTPFKYINLFLRKQGQNFFRRPCLKSRSDFFNRLGVQPAHRHICRKYNSFPYKLLVNRISQKCKRQGTVKRGLPFFKRYFRKTAPVISYNQIQSQICQPYRPRLFPFPQALQ